MCIILRTLDVTETHEATQTYIISFDNSVSIMDRRTDDIHVTYTDNMQVMLLCFLLDFSIHNFSLINPPIRGVLVLHFYVIQFLLVGEGSVKVR